jgi:hypothetical protein
VSFAAMVDANVAIHGTAIYFLFLLHAAPNCKGFQGEGLCTGDRVKETEKKNLSRIHHSFDLGSVGW